MAEADPATEKALPEKSGNLEVGTAENTLRELIDYVKESDTVLEGNALKGELGDSRNIGKEENNKNDSPNIITSKAEDGKQWSAGTEENNKQKRENETSNVRNSQEGESQGAETGERIILSTLSTEAPACPAIPEVKGLIYKYKPHWQVSTHELKQLVVIPEYLAEAMADAVASNGADAIVSPPPDTNICAPQCPILVFINSRSGSQLGADLLVHLSDLISPLQVYDLARTDPETLFRYGLGCLDRFSLGGDEIAQETRDNLRILVAGGDGTVGWVLTCINSFQETFSSSGHKAPPVGIIPLGTGNDLARSFGWGGHFPFATCHQVKKWLVRAVHATTAPLDSWHLLLKPSPSLSKSHLRLPHCLDPLPDSKDQLEIHVEEPSTSTKQSSTSFDQSQTSTKQLQTLAEETNTSNKQLGLPASKSNLHIEPNTLVKQSSTTYAGIFRNYFSIGMDAQVAFGFHNFRNHMPWIARGQLANQMIYGGFSCTQGWFCTACSCTNPRGVKNDVRLFVKKRSGAEWEFVYIPSK